MKFNPKLKQEIGKYKNYVIIVEGKKDINSMKSLGFEKVYAIHQTGISLRERIEEISNSIEKKDKICILTDIDKKGKKLYLLLKKEFSEKGVKLDSSLRGLIIKSGISHTEGIYKFMKRVSDIG